MKEGDVATGLADVITPGTSGIIALLNITAVDFVKQSMPQATKVETAPVDDETAAKIAAAAKEAPVSREIRPRPRTPRRCRR